MAPPPDIALWQQAISFACRAHAGQLRKDRRTPYAAHVLRVMMTVRTIFQCEDPVALAAAALHDTIEDTPADYDEIEEAFGPGVADAVAALTKNMILPNDEREADYDRRLADGPWHARLVKLADAYDNISDAGRLDDEEGTTARRARAIERGRRAIAVAQPDSTTHPEIRRGIDAVRKLIDAFENNT